MTTIQVPVQKRKDGPRQNNKNCQSYDSCLWQNKNRATERYSEHHYLRIPAGCRACGGPYPNCKSSCPLFDD